MQIDVAQIWNMNFFVYLRGKMDLNGDLHAFRGFEQKDEVMKQKNDNMNSAITKQIEQEFAYIDSIISAHTNSAIAKVNAEALQTYWEVVNIFHSV